MIGQNAGKCLLPPLASDPTNAHGVFRKQFVEQRNCNKKTGVMMMMVVQMVVYVYYTKLDVVVVDDDDDITFTILFSVKCVRVVY